MKGFLKRLGAGFLAAACILCAGCGGPAKESRSGTVKTVTDDKGYEVTVPASPSRIVTLALATDEMVLSMAKPERMAAVSKFAKDEGISTVAKEAAPVEHVLDEYQPEAILALHPDLVIAPDWTQDGVIQTLKDMGLPVYISRGSLSVEDTKIAVKEIADLIGEETAGETILNDMERDLAVAKAVRERIPENKRKTVILCSHMKGYVGKGSLFDALCREAGVINGAAAIGLGKSDKLTHENLIAMNPDIIFIPTWSSGTVSPESVIQELTESPDLAVLPAVQEKSFAQVPDAYIFCASPAMTKAIRGIQKAAYGNAGVPEKEAG